MSRSYCFTSFEKKAPQFNKEKHRYMVFQGEECPKTKRKHWQGYVELFNTQRIKATWEQMYPGIKFNGHFEKRKGSRIQARDYCMKKESQIIAPTVAGKWIGGQGFRSDLAVLVSRIEDGETNYQLLKRFPEQFERYHRFIDKARAAIAEEKQRRIKEEWHKNLELINWQIELLENLKKQTDRQILWVTDILGGRGKTFLSKYMMSKYKCQRFTNGRTKDISYAYDVNNEYVIFDFARSCEERINYQIIEDIKNGVIFNSKYESKCLMFNPPKVIIMANFEPDESKLSADRWTKMDLDKYYEMRQNEDWIEYEPLSENDEKMLEKQLL